MMRRQIVVCGAVQMRFGSSTDAPTPTSSATQILQRDLLQRSKLSAAGASPPDLGVNVTPKKSAPRPFVPVKHVLFGEVETTVCGGIDGIVNASIDSMIAAGIGGTVSEKVLLWLATFLSARPSHQQHAAADSTVLPLVTVLCELEKDVYSSAREHKKSSIYKASKDKAATTMDNARAIHHALDHAVQTHFLLLQASSSEGSEDLDKSQRIELARKLIVNVLLPLYEARLLALSNDFVGFVDKFDKVAKSIDEVMLEAHVIEALEKVNGSIPLINLYIDNTIRNSSTIISDSVIMAPEYFNKASRLKIPSDDSVAITLTPVAAAAKAAILAPATNVILVLYADKQNINHNIKGILSKHRQLKEQASSQKSTPSGSGAAAPKGPTLSVSAANAPTLKMPSWASSSSSPANGPATPPPANLSPEAVLKVASSTQILPHTLTRSTVDRESIQLLNALEYPHPTADDEDATDMHGNKAPKLTPEDKKRRQLEIAEQNKFLQHAPTLAVLQSVVAKAYGANNYTFGTSHKTHYIMTVVVPMALRFIKGDLPFLMATMAEEAKAAKAGTKPMDKKKDENPDLTDIVGAPNFPHFMDMRHSAASTSPWHPAFSVFARRPASFNHHPTQASSAGISAVSKDDFGFLIGLLIPLTVGFFLGVYIIMKLGKGIYWAVQWLIDEAGSYGLAPTTKKVNDASTPADKGAPNGTATTAATSSPAAASSGISISASAMSAAFDKDEPKK